MTDFSPLVRLGRIVKASTSDRLIVGGLTNPNGPLQFSDSVVTVPVTLSDLLAASSAEPASSGIKSGGLLSVASGTEVGIAAGEAVLIERLGGGDTVEHPTTWAAQDITSTRLAEAGSFWVVTDPGFTGTATIIEQSGPTTEYDQVELGVSVHRGGAVTAVLSAPQVYKDLGRLVRDALDTDDGLRRQSGSINEVASTLTSSNTAITMFGEGINWHVDAMEGHIATAPAANPTTFDTIRGDGSVIAAAQTAYPKQWNNSGTATALTGKNAVVHQVAVFPSGLTVCQMGTTSYKDFAEAVQFMGFETVNNPLWNVAAYLGVRMAAVVIAADATQWADTFARIYPSGVGGTGGGSGVSTYDELGDTPTSKAGQVGRVVAVNAAASDHEYADATGTFVWYSEGNKNSGAGVSALGTQHVKSANWIGQTIQINVETSPTTAALQVDIKAGGVSIVDGPLPSIGIGANTATANLLTAARPDGTALTVETISTDTTWASLMVEATGHARTA